MVSELCNNDRTAMSLLLKYCFYHNWHDFLLINYANSSDNIYFNILEDGVSCDIAEVIMTTLGYLKQWTEGVDISNIETDDMSVIRAFSSSIQEQGALLVVKKLFQYVNELQAIPEEDNSPRVETLLCHMRRCLLLIDLWYAGEDITYFGTMLDMR